MISALRKLTREILDARLKGMFESADDLLFEFAERARNSTERHVFFDTMRALRLGRSKLTEAFCEQVDAGFAPGKAAVPAAAGGEQDIDFDSITMQESRAVEQAIAVTNMQVRAEGAYQQQLWELRRRFDKLNQENGPVLSRDAASPASVVLAFQSSLQHLEVELESELVIYKLFDRRVMGELADLYKGLLRRLDDSGVKASQVVVALPRVARLAAVSAAPAEAPGPGQQQPVPPSAFDQSGTFAAFDLSAALPPMPQVRVAQRAPAPPAASSYAAFGDANTLAMLQAVAAQLSSAGGRRGEAELVSNLSAALQGVEVPDWGPSQARAYAQRASLVGVMFNELLDDPALPESVKPKFDSLRFSVIKNALNDLNFFTDPKHPVRTMVNELATMAATARTTNLDALKRIEDLVGQIQTQFSEAADPSRTEQQFKPGTIAQADVGKFVAEQEKQQRLRHEATIQRARAAVSAELKLRTDWGSLPRSAQLLLGRGWAPMMAMRLIRLGADSPAWDAGLKLLKRVQQALDPEMVTARAPQARQELFRELEVQMGDAGIVNERIADLLRPFEETLCAIGAGPVAVSPAPVQAVAEAVASPAPPEPSEPVASPPPAPQVEALVPVVAAAPSSPAKPDPAAPRAPAAAAAPSDAKSGLLKSLMVPGGWFHIADAQQQGHSRAVRLVAHYAEHDSYLFAEFNGRNSLRVAGSELMEGLLSRKSAPIDAEPAAWSALQSAIEQRASH